MSEPATNAGMNTLVAVAIAPCGTGDELSAEVAEVVRDATFVLASKGIRTEVVLKADIRPGFTDTMTGKLKRMEAQIKKQEEAR